MTLASPLGLVATALFAEYTGITVWFLIGGIVTLVCGGLTLALPAVRTCDLAQGQPLRLSQRPEA